MNDDPAQNVVIHSKRSKLAIQALAIVGVGIAVGTVLQAAGVMSTSPLGRLGVSTGLPVVALVISGVAMAIAVVVVRDSWNATITLGQKGMTVRDSLGHYDLPYANILEVKAVPLGGVVVAIREPELWLTSASGDTGIRRRTAAVISSQYGGHVWFHDKDLSPGGPAFIEMVERRISAQRAET